MKGTLSIRLSDEARQRLAELMADQDRSAGWVIEDLILRGHFAKIRAIEAPKPKPQKSKPITVKAPPSGPSAMAIPKAKWKA